MPAEFRFDGKEVFVERVANGVPLRPKPVTLGEWLSDLYATTEPVPGDFLEDYEQGAAQDSEWFRDENA